MEDNRIPKPPIWLLVDGNNQVVTDANGAGVMNAAAVFRRRLQQLINWWEPDCVITCWDSTCLWRRELIPEYKQGRIKLPGIENAIAAARDDMKAIGVGVMDVEGFEADDLIATLAYEALRHQANAVMYSRDKDLHQCLIDGKVCQLLKAVRVKHPNGKIGRMELSWRNSKDLRVEFGIKPEQWIDYQCLVGQSSDNIRGVRGVGDKIARQILKNCETLEVFFSNPWKAGVSTKTIAAVSNSKRYLLGTARPVCTLRRDVPLPEMWREAC